MINLKDIKIKIAIALIALTTLFIVVAVLIDADDSVGVTKKEKTIQTLNKRTNAQKSHMRPNTRPALARLQGDAKQIRDKSNAVVAAEASLKRVELELSQATDKETLDRLNKKKVLIQQALDSLQ